MTQTVKNLPARQETSVRSLGQEDPLEKAMAILQYSCLENPMDRGAWLATVHELSKESDMTERLTQLRRNISSTKTEHKPIDLSIPGPEACLPMSQ